MIMKLTRRQIAIITASLVVFQENLDKTSKMYEEIEEITGLLDEEYQKLT